jgi:serine/threonine protein phosphatase PrpC
MEPQARRRTEAGFLCRRCDRRLHRRGGGRRGLAETASRAAAKLAAIAYGSDEGVDWDLISRQVSMAIAREAEFRRLVPVQTDEDTIDEHLKRVREATATTLIVAVISRNASADGSFPGCIANLAGDSAGYLLAQGGITPAVGGKDTTAEITSTAVRPLPGSSTPEVHPFSMGEAQGFVLVSDGVSDPLGDGSGDVGQTLGDAWSTPPRIDTFLNDLNFFRRTFDDDRTAVGVWLLPPLDDGSERAMQPAMDQVPADA